jgi:hypothetical protein
MNYLAHYSVIELLPNPERREVVNVGILVRHQDKWDVRVTSTTDKVQALNPRFPEGGLVSIAMTLQSLLKAAPTLAAAKAFLDKLGGNPGLQEFVGQFPANDRAEYENEIDWLLSELVTPPTLPRDPVVKVAPEHRLRTKLRTHFKRKHLLGKRDEINEHKIVEKFPIEAAKGLFAEFALKNGCMHITETVDFDVSESSERNKRMEAQAKTLILSAARTHLGDNTKTYVVISGSNRKAAQPSISLLEDYAEVFALESADDMSTYFNKIYAAAKANQGGLTTPH